MAENNSVSRSELLPSDRFEQTLSRLIGLPGGSSVQPTIVQCMDFYGRSSDWIVQSVKTEEGDNLFLTCVTSEGVTRIAVPARVVATIDRQRETLTTKVRRRHGRRLAEERKARGEAPGFMKGRRN